MGVIKTKFVTLSEVEVDGKPAFAIKDGDGYLLNKDEIAEVIAKINLLYDVEEAELNSFLNESNRSIFFANLGCSEDDIYTVMNQSVYEMKMFNPKRKREVKYNCTLCNGIIDSKETDHYYRIPYIRGLSGETACSEACIKIIWKEWLNNNLKERGYKTI